MFVRTASDVLAAVNTTMAKNNVQKVTAAGHSLGKCNTHAHSVFTHHETLVGAALSAIEGAFLLLNLPGVDINVIGYGMPRVIIKHYKFRNWLIHFQVGNQAFADFMNAKIPVTRVNNQYAFAAMLNIFVHSQLIREDLVPTVPGKNISFRQRETNSEYTCTKAAFLGTLTWMVKYT